MEARVKCFKIVSGDFRDCSSLYYLSPATLTIVILAYYQSDCLCGPRGKLVLLGVDIIIIPPQIVTIA